MSMRLYSRAQVLVFSLIGLAIGLLLAVGLGIIPLGSEHGQTAAGEKEQPEQAAFQLQTSTPREEPLVAVRDAASYSEDELENIRIYDQLNQGVVNITTEIVGYNWFLEPVPQEGGTGSGSIIDKRGYVLTNYHVVENAYKVFVTLADGTQFEGQVIGSDPETDLAVVQFDPKGKELVTVPFGTSDSLRVGQKVLAIGNPFAYDRTLTTGIVSGLERPIKTSSNVVIRQMIQTDASINPGNSGGPLLNSRGQMIGINTVIYSPSGGSVGIGFAVPVDTARRVVPELIEYGRVRRGWIEIAPVQLFPSLVRYAELPVQRGILVSRVLENGNADEAGIRGGDRRRPLRFGRSVIYLGGDIIVKVDGDTVGTLADLYSALEDNRPGETVEVEVYRGKGTRTFQVTLSERPENFQIE